MKQLVLIVVVVLTVLCTGQAGLEKQPIAVEIAAWKDNASGAVTLSFDDGYVETYENILPILEEQGVRATFNIISGKTGGVYGKLRLAEWHHWKEAASMGHEVASHTEVHLHVDELPPNRLEKELILSKNTINENLGLGTQSFVYPGGAYDSSSKEVIKRQFISARTSDDGYNNPSPEDMHLLKSKTAAGFNVKKMNDWADTAKDKGLWLIENYHLVSDKNPSNYSFYLPTKDFKTHLDYLASKKLWVATQQEVAKYIIERENTIVSVKSTSDSEIVISLSNTLNSSIYGEPLTLIISNRPDWESIAAEQNDVKLDFYIQGEDIIIDAMPNNGDITLKKGGII